jgi:hypothetical protein
MAEKSKENSSNVIGLKLSIDEVNTLLSALGNMPYVQVYDLIQKLHEQAGQQLKSTDLPDS